MDLGPIIRNAWKVCTADELMEEFAWKGRRGTGWKGLSWEKTQLNTVMYGN